MLFLLNDNYTQFRLIITIYFRLWYLSSIRRRLQSVYFVVSLSDAPLIFVKIWWFFDVFVFSIISWARWNGYEILRHMALNVLIFEFSDVLCKNAATLRNKKPLKLMYNMCYLWLSLSIILPNKLALIGWFSIHFYVNFRFTTIKASFTLTILILLYVWLSNIYVQSSCAVIFTSSAYGCQSKKKFLVVCPWQRDMHAHCQIGLPCAYLVNMTGNIVDIDRFCVCIHYIGMILLW